MNLSEEELAYAAGVTKRLIENIESDPTYNIKMRTAVQISGALGLPVFVVFLPEELAIFNGVMQDIILRQAKLFTSKSMLSMFRFAPRTQKLRNETAEARSSSADRGDTR